MLSTIRGGAGESPQQLLQSWVDAKQDNLDAAEDLLFAQDSGDQQEFQRAVAAEASSQQRVSGLWKALVAAGVFPQPQQRQGGPSAPASA